MGNIELILLGIGLAMDAFAVSICKGLSMKKVTVVKAGTVGLWFGGFQALMPLLGYFFGMSFEKYITAVDHWIAFILLLIIGLGMIKEALGAEDECPDASLAPGTMLLLALATSIDALAVGITFAFLKVDILLAITIIGLITFFISAAGVRIGNIFGRRYQAKAELAGGGILILLGTKILLEHLGILVF